MPLIVGILLVAVVVGGGLVGATGRAGGAARGAPDASQCAPGEAPIDLPGTELIPEVRTSSDDEPVHYVLWRGTAPSFDGMPLSVDVTVPCDAPTAPAAPAARPTVVMAHGFTDDKTVWEETDKSDTVESPDRPGPNSHWNNIWFASRGYVVVNYTARGWRDSCGPDTSGHSVAEPSEECAPYEFWTHLNDKRWEVRDAQWLAGSLAQSGIGDPERLAITGGSYGGGPTTMGALLADRMVCGATAVPAELGPDPCTGADDGELVPWTTPDGTIPLSWVAAVPLYTYGDLLNVLAPNGRVSDGWEEAPASASPVEPFGVPLAGTVSGLLTAASLTASVPPPGSDPESDITTSTQRLLAGDPFPLDDPEVAQGVALYRELKSPITIEPQGAVPIFWVQGMTDALFPATEALSVRNHVRGADPSYPFKLFLGDIGHDYAAEQQDDWDLVKVQMNDFLDHYLRPDRTPEAPVFDVGASVTRCFDPDETQQYVSAADWHDLHPDQVVLTDDTAASTSTAEQGPAGLATDPISGATLPGPDSYKGCRIMSPSETDPTTATYEFELSEDLVLMGGPVVDLTFSADVAGIPLAVRVWDVDEAGEAQALVTRGVYRVEGGAAPTEATARFQLSPQGYRFRTGHQLKVEVTGNDSPYLQESNIDTDITVHRLSITLPRHDEDRAVAPSNEAADGRDDQGGGGPSGDGADEGSGTGPSPWWLLVAVAAAAGGTALWLRRNRTRPAR
jgi:predicted acyl esterase